MSNEEFENYLALVSRLLRLNRWQRELIGSELRDHLETRVDELVESGVDRRQAVRSALEEFGDAAGLARQFQMISNLHQRRWMMRFATFSILGTFVLAVLLMAMWPPQARFGAPSSSLAQEEFSPQVDPEDPFGNEKNDASGVSSSQDQVMTWDEKLRNCLTKEWSPNFDETPFIEVVEQLQGKFGINVVLDQSALDDSLSEDEPITFAVRAIPLANALKLMLQKHNATYVVMDDVLRIISLDVAGDPEYFRRKIFDCRSLLRLIAAAEAHRVGKPISIQPIGTGDKNESVKGGAVKSGGAGFGGGGGVGNVDRKMPTDRIFQIVWGENEEQLAKAIEKLSRAERAQATGQPNSKTRQPIIAGHFMVKTLTAEQVLESLIKTSVDPEGWDNTNGDGSLVIVGGCMVVSQTESTLAEIQSLLDDITQQLRLLPR